MGTQSVMFCIIAVLLILSVQLVSTRTSFLNLTINEPFNLSKHVYLTTSKCKAAIQCAVACVSTPECVLADVDSGILYRQGERHSPKKQLITNYVVDLKKSFEELRPEGKGFDFLMIAQTKTLKGKALDVYKVSMDSNMTEKTGISMKIRVISIAYDRLSNTLLWSHRGIFKQVIELNSKMKQSSKVKKVLNLNINNGTLFYTRKSEGKVCIYTHNHSIRDSQQIWLCRKSSRISYFVVDGNVACWIQDEIKTIYCLDMATKKTLFTQPGRKVIALALSKVSSLSMLLFADEGDGTSSTTILKINPRETTDKPKEISSAVGVIHLYIGPGYLIYTFIFSNKVEIWEITENGVVGKKLFSIDYPLSGAFTVLVAIP